MAESNPIPKRKRPPPHSHVDKPFVFCSLALTAVFFLTIVPAALAGERGAVGDLYACNVRHGNILQFDGLTGDFVCIFAERPAALGELDFRPFDLAFAPNGNLVVTSAGAFPRTLDTVVEYDGQTGAFLSYIVTPDPAAVCEIGLSFGGPDGNLYVQDKTQSWGDETHGFDRATHAYLGVAASASPPVQWPQIVRFTSSGTVLVVGSVVSGPPAATIGEWDATTFQHARNFLWETGAHRAGVVETPDGCCYLVSEVSGLKNNIERFDIE
ncbi:MAG: hypothetical protein GY778_07030, partial [bacterium]|nr:hypothetical protein [bacterium]